MIGQPMPLLNQKEWGEFAKFTHSCENAKPVRGGSVCVLDGITGHCNPYGCPKWRK